jgi:hypothetical protein
MMPVKRSSKGAAEEWNRELDESEWDEVETVWTQPDIPTRRGGKAVATPSLVGTEQLEDGAVTSDKLAPGAVTGDKLAAGAVEDQHLGIGLRRAIQGKLDNTVGELLLRATPGTPGWGDRGGVTPLRLANAQLSRDNVFSNSVSIEFQVKLNNEIPGLTSAGYLVMRDQNGANNANDAQFLLELRSGYPSNVMGTIITADWVDGVQINRTMVVNSGGLRVTGGATFSQTLEVKTLVVGDRKSVV